jgi:hypothetical protein
MRSYESGASIDADPERVWAVLTDAHRWPSWDSGVERVDGTVGPGETIKVTSSANPGRAYPVEVAELAAPRRMVWRGGMPLGLFRGVRTYELEPRPGGTEFRMREEFSGPLLPVIWRSIPDLGPSFRQFAAGLKAEAEQRRA